MHIVTMIAKYIQPAEEITSAKDRAIELEDYC